MVKKTVFGELSSSNQRDRGDIDKSLRIAVRVKDAVAVKIALAAGADPNAKKSDSGESLLSSAVKHGDFETVRALLDAGADPNKKERMNVSPLHRAAESENVRVLETLIAAGAKVDARDSLGRTALHYAKRPQAVERLVLSGADLEAEDVAGKTPLCAALSDLRAKNHGVVTALIGCGADPCSPLRRGVKDNAVAKALTELCLKKMSAVELPNESLSWTGRGALCAAVVARNAAGVREALASGADPNALMPAKIGMGSRKSVLFCAVEHGDIETVEALLAGGADPNFKTSPLGKAPLHVAVELQGKFSALTGVLVRNGADIDVRDVFGSVPLHFAATPEAVRTLLAGGADLEARDSGGKTPLYSAVSFRGPNSGVVRAMLRAGADPCFAYRPPGQTRSEPPSNAETVRALAKLCTEKMSRTGLPTESSKEQLQNVSTKTDAR